MAKYLMPRVSLSRDSLVLGKSAAAFPAEVNGGGHTGSPRDSLNSMDFFPGVANLTTERN